MAKLATLTDNFNDNSRDTVLWGAGGTTWTYAETNQRTEMTTTTGGGQTYFYSKSLWDVTASYMLLHLITAGSLANSTYRVYLRLQIDGSNFVAFKFNGSGSGNIEAIHNVAGSETVVGSGVTYNTTTHAWLRIREASGTTYWDYSADGLSWSNLASEANPITLTALEVSFETYGDAYASTTACIFDDFNIAPTPATVVKDIIGGMGIIPFAR